MARGVRWYLVGSIGFGVLGVLTGCSGGFFFAEREPWRREAELTCLNAGAVREGPGVVRIAAIRGPGVCGADYPFKVSVLGASSPLGYSDELRPPGDIPLRSPATPRWPVAPPGEMPAAAPRATMPDQPVSLSPPGAVDRGAGAPESYDFRRPSGASPSQPRYRAPPPKSPREDFSPEPYERRPLVDAPTPSPPVGVNRGPLRGEPPPLPPLGPAGDPRAGASLPPVALSPMATLACPMVSELDRWIAGAVQPAAMRWFGSRSEEHTSELQSLRH